MTPRRLRLDTATLWFGAPFVIALRVQEMQIAALTGKTQDLAELYRMISEKVAATADSFVAVNVALWKASFDNTMRMMMGGKVSGHATAIASAALRPYGKRVRSNARRLSRKKS
ncbi:hypothetical protein [Sinorhizobium terangae]|uniref:Phasin domain-containing protein n=1 Tax=Sinorhizobium terangae TaxID=110322 RepID=A0A6N7L9E2_SINTE|nr:hypothetical protein [Sinorhizobium terangae]MBB4188123.1 hypothetical protein [Sinorhizobium terangae]MQX14497.1 hypothetical protein [Sinorhizobium terangae]WFU49431.1 hypothetical protein QA637_08540 [Sinorhizobium terangae]